MKNYSKAIRRRDFLNLAARAPLPFLLFSSQLFFFSSSTSYQKKVSADKTQIEWQTRISEISQRYGAEFGDVRLREKEA